MESNDDKLDEEIKARKEKLKLQKQQALLEEDGVDFIPKPSKKEKKKKPAMVAA